MINFVDLSHKESRISQGFNRIVILLRAQLLLFISKGIFKLDLDLLWINHFATTVTLVLIIA